MATVTTDYSSLTELVSALDTAPDYRTYFDDWRAPYDNFVDAAEGVALLFDGFGTGTELSGSAPGITSWTVTGSNIQIPGIWTINQLELTDFAGGNLVATSVTGVKFNTTTLAVSGSLSQISYELGGKSVDLEGSGPANGTASFTVKHLQIGDTMGGGYSLILESTAGVSFNNNPDSLSFMTPVSGVINSIDLTIGAHSLVATGLNINALAFYNADTEAEIIALVNSIFGGNNTHTATGDNETLLGGGGNDIYDFVAFQPGEASELANGGTDGVKTQFDHVLGAAIENATLTGALDSDLAGNDLKNVLLGNDGANSLSGGAANDTLTGGAGNDSLDGGAGKDNMAGGAGDDTYTANLVNLTATTVGLADLLGAESLAGGNDTVLLTADGSVTQNTTVFVYALGANVENLSYTATANPLLINATGNLLDNSIIGNNANNLIKGGAGNDTLIGANGNDTLDGELGNDSYVGGDNDDTYVVTQVGDTLFAGEDNGIDTVRLALAAGTAFNNLTTGGFAELENVVFIGTAAVSLTGNALGNSLAGGGGGDTLDGAAGADSMAGGAGNDTYVKDNAGDQITDSGGIDAVVVTGGLSASLADFTGIERLTLSGASGTGTGSAIANILTSSGGTHILVGLAGNDTYNVSFGDTITEAADSMGGKDLAIVSLADGENYVLDDNVENLTLVAFEANGAATGNNSNNSIIGGALMESINGGGGNDTIISGGGNDTLDGGDGKDVLVGGLGDDTYRIWLVNPTPTTLAIPDTVTEAAASGYDALEIYDDGLTANTLPFVLTLGANIEKLDFSTVDANAKINVVGNALDNDIEASVGASKIDGGAGNDSIWGDYGNDTLLGGTGNDTLYGGSDNDSLDGGMGNDTYVEDEHNDTYLFSQLGDAVTLAGGFNHGIDTAIVAVAGHAVLDISTAFNFIEHVTYTAAIGAAITGNASANSLKGGGGADTINGGAGIDSMDGGAGNDVFHVDTFVGLGTSDSVAGGAGYDTVVASVTYVLIDFTSGVERLELKAGAGNINGYGDTKANVIVGNEGNNQLEGGFGLDTLIGGAGNDEFVIRSPEPGNGPVRIVDFEVGVDRIELSAPSFYNALFAGAGLVEGTNMFFNATLPNGVIGVPVLIYLQGTGQLYYDADGLGVSAKVLLATFGDATHPAPALHSTDFEDNVV